MEKVGREDGRQGLFLTWGWGLAICRPRELGQRWGLAPRNRQVQSAAGDSCWAPDGSFPEGRQDGGCGAR